MRNLFGLLVTLILFSFGCKNDKDKSKIKAVIPVCNKKLYLQKFEIFGGGAHDGDRISAYLTDSANFRIFLLTYDNAHEGIGVDCKGTDSVYISMTKRDVDTDKFVVSDLKKYSISDLVNNKLME